MWNKRKDEDPPRPYIPSVPSPVAPSPIEVRKETLPVSSFPVPKHEPEGRGGPASIGKAVKVVGQIFSKEDLYVDGELEGTLEALEHKVTVGPNGTVKAAVKAREVVVLGAIHGNVEATERMDIRKDAKLVGDVRTARIVIEDGAYFKGSIDIVKPEQKPAPKAASVAPPIVNVSAAPPLKL